MKRPQKTISSHNQNTMNSFPLSPQYSQRTTDTPLGRLFEAVPQLQKACFNASAISKEAIFSQQKVFLLNAPQLDQRMRRDITTAFLPTRKDVYTEISDNESPMNLKSAYQTDIQDKFELYAQKSNRYSILDSQRLKFTAKDFFSSVKSINALEQNDAIGDDKDQQMQLVQVMSKQQFFSELKKLRHEMTQTFKAMNIKQLPNIFQSLLRTVVSTKNSFYLAYCLFFCGSISSRLQNYKYAIYFLDQCKVVCNLNLKELTDLKLDLLIQLGVCSRDLNDHVGSVTILKKALQYTWFLNDKIKESIIYDHMGLAYYYQNNMQQAIFYHHRSTHDLSESDTSTIKQLSTVMIRALVNCIQDINQPQIISQAVLNQLNMPYVQINMYSPTKVDANPTSTRSSTKRQSVYKEYFKSTKIYLSPNQNVNLNKQSGSDTLVLMVLDSEIIINRLLIDREFQYRVSSPRNYDQQNQTQKKNSGIFYDRKRISNKSLIPLGPLPLSVNNLLKFNPQKYKMNLESKIRHRNEGIKLTQPNQEILTSQLSKNVCLTHKSRLRGQLTCKGGLAVDDLLKILESAFSVLLAQLNSL